MELIVLPSVVIVIPQSAIQKRQKLRISWLTNLSPTVCHSHSADHGGELATQTKSLRELPWCIGAQGYSSNRKVWNLRHMQLVQTAAEFEKIYQGLATNERLRQERVLDRSTMRSGMCRAMESSNRRMSEISTGSPREQSSS